MKKRIIDVIHRAGRPLLMAAAGAGCCAAASAANAAPVEVPVKTILFVGDSISCGVGASSPQKRYTTVVVDLLNKAAGRIAYKEVNVAVSGSTMADQPWPRKGSSGYPYRLKDVNKIKPDIVVIQHGVNDNCCGISLAEYSWSYREFVRTVKKKHPQATIVCMTACPTKRPEVFYSEWINQSNTAVQEIAAREGTLLAQVNLAINNRMELFPDGIHPNDAGHQIIAEEVAKTIQANKPVNLDNFDLVIQRPGAYRICGYVFKVSPECAKNGAYTCFYGVSKQGWKYQANGPVKVFSPVKYYLTQPECILDNGLPVKSTYRSYFKDGTWTLPPTDGKTVQAVIQPIKKK